MKEILLSKEGKNRGIYVALVDDDVFDYLNQWDWSVAHNRGAYYAARSERNSDRTISRVLMHRVIMNAPNHLQTDHIDHDGLNNQRYNLRLCTKRENLCNRVPRGNSQYLGVCRLKSGLYQTLIQKKEYGRYKRKFKNEIDAAMAYDAKAKEWFGEFANLNFK